jgi:hypothetical protein
MSLRRRVERLEAGPGGAGRPDGLEGAFVFRDIPGTGATRVFGRLYGETHLRELPADADLSGVPDVKEYANLDPDAA